jgi:DNA repair exonuclease SbcCD ATPase subunit
MSKAELVKALPELLKQGMEVYKSLKDDMSRALGLKKYAEHLSTIVQTFKEVNKYLDKGEKAIMEKLTTAHARAQEGMDKAAVVVTVIKEQSGALVSVLDPSAVGTDQEKMWAACQYFSSFAKDMEEKVKEAEDALREASNILEGAQNKLRSIVNTLERVQDQFVQEKKAAQAAARAEAYGGAAAGLVFGPIGLIISYSIAAGVTEGLSIPNIEKDFQAQRDTISGYIKGFEDMSAETKALQKKLDAKRKQLIDIHGKLSATGSLAGIEMRSIAVLHFNLVRKNAQALVEACEKFLANI